MAVLVLVTSTTAITCMCRLLGLPGPCSESVTQWPCVIIILGLPIFILVVNSYHNRTHQTESTSLNQNSDERMNEQKRREKSNLNFGIHNAYTNHQSSTNPRILYSAEIPTIKKSTNNRPSVRVS